MHEARVSARRVLARAAGSTLEARLKRVIHRLGPLRNLDVALGIIRTRDLRDRRERERAAVGRWLTEGRIRRLERSLSAWRPGEPDVERWRCRLRRTLHKWSRRFDEELAHELRRRVRYLRYAVEASASPDRRLLGFLRRLQEVGGAWHDFVMIRDLVGGGFRRELARHRARYLRGVHRLRKELP